MSVKQHVNDDEKEIHELPEITTLPEGMMVAVDSERTGTKSFNLTDALEEKVDSPATAPTTGQALMFDGTDNVWSDPPKGIYMLKYSEVTDLDDVDLEKATTIPTFILIDSKQTLVIGNGSSGTTITLNAGTIMRLEEVGDPDTASGKPKLLTFVNDYGNSATGGTYSTYGNYFVRLVVSKSSYGGVSKQFGVSADIWNSALFRSQQIPVVKKYDNARGPAGSSGNLNGDANSLIVSFEDAGSNKRRQLLPPAELASHVFYSDASPELLQFMAWGATSNRAGYRTCLIATHSTRSSEYPQQTPSVAFNRYVMGSSETSDNVATSVNVEMISSVSGQGSAMFGGNLVPTLGTAGALQYWSDNNGTHYGFKPVNELPATTSSDSGKILTVDSTGSATFKQLIKSHDVPDSTTYPDQTPEKVQFTRVAGSGNPSTADADQIYTQVSAKVKSADGASNIYYSGMLAPNRLPDSRIGYLTCWSDSKGSHFAWKPPIANIGALTDAATITTTMLNNGFATLSTSQSNLTIVDDVFDADEVVNFCIEITPSVNCTLTIKKLVHGESSSVTLKHSVAGGNTLEANKTYQVTAVGNCWTLAEFEA